MSTTDQVRAILGGTQRAYRAEPAYRERPDVFKPQPSTVEVWVRIR